MWCTPASMAEQKHDDHPELPGLTAMVVFALILGVALITLTLMLQFKFGNPTPG